MPGGGLSIEDILAAPAEEVSRLAPQSMVLAAGGTRRAAALAGIDPQSDGYACWSRERMIACCERLFRLGVRHVFTIAIRSRQLAEIGRYRERLLDWVDWGLAGPEALADYRTRRWRVRLQGTEGLPELKAASDRLASETAAEARHTLWWYVVPELDSSWAELLEAARRCGARNRSDLVRALYGEEIPPISLYLGFGKPLVAPDLLPPLLMGDVQCYWTQRPGYEIDEPTIRRIFYDYACLRRTWSADRGARYADIDSQRSLWETSAVLGLGRRAGGFWYPAGFPEAPEEGDLQ